MVSKTINLANEVIRTRLRYLPNIGHVFDPGDAIGGYISVFASQ